MLFAFIKNVQPGFLSHLSCPTVLYLVVKTEFFAAKIRKTGKGTQTGSPDRHTSTKESVFRKT